MGRVWLDVPYSDKEQAKMAGARWDPSARRWYAPTPAAAVAGGRLARWAALPDLPVVLAGEDRGFGAGLFVDLVPSSCWFTNVRSCVSQRDWERIRRMVTTRAHRRCEACHSPEDRALGRWLDVHERWSYDEVAGVQTLRRLICLCSHCHTVTHFGLAEVKGLAAEALERLVMVTGMSEHDAAQHGGRRVSAVALPIAAHLDP